MEITLFSKMEITLLKGWGLLTAMSSSAYQKKACPMLEKTCEEEKGEDWDKIAAIPYIEINHRPIGSPSGGTHLSQVLILH